MKSNLTKKEIDLISTEDLNIRYCYILDRAEKSKAEDIPVTDAREVLWIEDVLYNRLIKQLDCDPYPPDRIEKQTPSNYMISLLKSRQEKPEEKTEGKFSFKIIVKSSIGSVIAEQNVKVNSKSEAEIEAHEIIKRLGLKKATYKIS